MNRRNVGLMQCCSVLGSWILDPESQIISVPGKNLVPCVLCFPSWILCLGCFVVHHILRISYHFRGFLYLTSYQYTKLRGRFFPQPFFVCMICVTLVPKRHTLISSQITQDHITSLIRHTIPGKVIVCCSVVQCMILWLNRDKILHWHALVVERSLIVLRPSQAFRYEKCECRILLAIIPAMAYRTCVEPGSRRGSIGTTRRHEWLVCVKDFGCNTIR